MINSDAENQMMMTADEKNDFNNFGDQKADDEKDTDKDGQSKSDEN